MNLRQRQLVGQDEAPELWMEIQAIVDTINFIGEDAFGFLKSVREELIDELKRNVN